MKNILMNIKLRDKIVILCLCFFVMITSTFYFLSYQKSLTILETKVNENSSITLEQVNLHISYILLEMDRIANMISNNNMINEFLYQSINEDDRIKQIESYFGLKPLLNDILKSYDKYGINIYLPHKVLYTEEGIHLHSEESINNLELFNQIVEKNGGVVWGGNNDLDNSLIKKVVNQHRVLKHYFSGNRIGILEVFIDTKYFEDILTTVKIGEGSVTYLMDTNGNVLVSNHSVPADEVTQDKLQVFNGLSKGTFKTGRGYNGRLVIFNREKNTSWALVTSIPNNILYESSRKMRNSSIVSVCIMLVIVILLIYLLLNNVTKRINRLVRLMSNFEINGLKVQINRVSNDEIGQLEKKFNDLSQRINNLITETLRAEHIKKEAQLKVLQAQINPHFLYNTLDTVNWMAINREAYDISSMITALSKFFRLTLNKGNEIITFRDEIEIVKQYLFIQKIRYCDELQVDYQINDDILRCQAVKLTLQPIIENAIKHGIQPSSRLGKILIIAKKNEDNKVEVRVIDNGVGYKKNNSAANESHPYSNGYGLQNILQRLKQYFGENCTISILNREEKGTEVIVSWPVIQETYEFSAWTIEDR